MLRPDRGLLQVIAILAVCGAMMADPIPTAEAGTVTITAAVLDVQHRVGSSGPWIRSRVGVTLPAGSRVRTGPRARCEVTFPGGTRVRMGPRSDLVITDPATRRARVVAGEVFASVVAGTGGAQIQGATATAAVRGTELTLKVVDDGTLPDPESPEAEEWYSFDSELPYGHHSLARMPTGPGIAASQQAPSGGSILVQAWFGNVDISGPFGAFTLGPNMGGTFGPAAGPTGFSFHDSFPNSFGTGMSHPFYHGFSSGAGIGTKPGGIGGRDFRIDQSGARQQITYFMDEMERGAVDVVVQSESAVEGTAGLTSSAALTGAAWGLAAMRQESTQELLGRRFFGPQYQVDLLGVVHDDGALAGGWLRSTAIYEDFYGELGVQALTDFDGDDDLRISDLFVLYRGGDTDLTVGRQRWLKGPVNNTALGSLFGVTHFDGITVHGTGGTINTFFAWLDDFDAWGRPRISRSGWLGRASMEIDGGLMGANLLLARDNIGWSIDGAFPISPREIDMYFELGRDHDDRALSTMGLYFPGLYRSSEVDLYVERANRDGYDPLWSAAAYWEASERWTGLAGLRHAQDDGTDFMLGVAKRIGSLEP